MIGLYPNLLIRTPLITLETVLARRKMVASIPACIVVKPNSSMKTGINAKFIISKTCVNMWLRLITLKRLFLVIVA